MYNKPGRPSGALMRVSVTSVSAMRGKYRIHTAFLKARLSLLSA